MKYLLLLVLLPYLIFANDWVDTTYSIKVENDLVYGEAIDFAGKEQELLLDITIPVGDTPPDCGRPLAIVVHGGAWLAGSKDDANIKRISQDFAKRGYVTANMNYRLGMFHTDKNIHCNVEGWDCFNVSDTAEWYRAYFRAIQDVNDALKYMLINFEKYDIDPNNIFLIGESAGAYNVIGAGYIDSDNEVMLQYTKQLMDAPKPNSIYESPCIQELDIAESIESMSLERPDLGSYQGEQYHINIDYDIKAVGAFYGGVFNNVFKDNDATKPSLYMFHQPNDLIVPINYNRVLQGFASCARGFPLNCQDIVSRLHTWGSGGINAMLETISAISLNNIDYRYEVTNNNAPCLEQVANPATSGHSFDNFWLRTNELAEFFATKIEDCQEETDIEIGYQNSSIRVYPNPVNEIAKTTVSSIKGQLQITDMYGNVLLDVATNGLISLADLDLNFSSGVYIITVIGTNEQQTSKIIVQN